jgi:hypothetical protein
MSRLICQRAHFQPRGLAITSVGEHTATVTSVCQEINDKEQGALWKQK